MLKLIRHQVINLLWQQYRLSSPQMQLIEIALGRKGIHQFCLDHFAIIDLPGSKTGIPQLSAIFASLGYEFCGQDYLADKQNDFLWMSEAYEDNTLAEDMLPQVVVADFRLDEMPIEIKKIICKYANQSSAFPQSEFDSLINKINEGDKQANQLLTQMINSYFTGRGWSLPSTHEFKQVQEFNELLAWVLIYGRKPNHYTLAIHLLNQFSDLESFHQFIATEVNLELNSQGGIVKGGKHIGIAQGSTVGHVTAVELNDGIIQLPTGFVEFVWRYPVKHMTHPPKFWQDYFTGFIANHANNVVESLFMNQ